MPGPQDRFINSAVVATNQHAAALLARRHSPIREKPEQLDDFRTALRLALKDNPYGFVARAAQLQVRARLAPAFPGLDPVDLAIEQQGVPKILFEMKLGRKEVADAAWDLCKLAVALREDVTRRAFMVGAAARSERAGEGSGLALFDTRRWEAYRLLASYRNSFEKRSTVPRKLPLEIRTELIDAVRFRNGSVEYEMRLIEVSLGNREYVPVDQDPANWSSAAAL
ncbi:MAG: hypothetical protein WBW44_07955 [Solirubrobacterales bacterium]